jgi:D-alanyl-lipoteichoic acid acyltransferase DltB (MBOAT superfamily)
MWIRDYVFFPMAISRRWSGRLGAGGMALVTMVVMGVWHGATWVFVLWGLYHGALLAIYRRVRPHLFRQTQYESWFAKRAWHLVCVLFTFSLVAVSELFFRPVGNEDVSALSQCGAMCWALLTNPTTTLASYATIVAVVKICAVLFVLDLAESWSDREEAVLSWPTLVRRLLQAIMLFSMMNALSSQETSLGQPFRYFQV